MGSDKATLDIGGQTVLQSLVDRFHAVSGEVIVVSREDQALSVRGAKIVRDNYANAGPVAGLHAGLVAAEETVNFVIGCDYPFASREVARALIGAVGPRLAAVPEIGGRLQPLSAAYSRSCLPVIEAFIESGRRRLTDLVEEMSCVRVSEEDMKRIDPTLQSFLNVNTPQDYAKALEILAGSSE